MKIIFKKSLRILTLLGIAGVILISGCSSQKNDGKDSKIESKEIFQSFKNSYDAYDSVLMNVKVDLILYEDETADEQGKITMNGELSCIREPEISNLNGTANAVGVQTEYISYTQAANDVYETYLYTDSTDWMHTTTGQDQYNPLSVLNIDSLIELSDEFEVQDDTEKIGEKDCYVVSGDISAEQLFTIYDSTLLSTNCEGIQTSNVSVTLYISKEDNLFYGLDVNIEGTEKGAYPKKITLSFMVKEYNSVESIEIPEEALKAETVEDY